MYQGSIRASAGFHIEAGNPGCKRSENYQSRGELTFRPTLLTTFSLSAGALPFGRLNAGEILRGMSTMVFESSAIQRGCAVLPQCSFGPNVDLPSDADCRGASRVLLISCMSMTISRSLR